MSVPSNIAARKSAEAIAEKIIEALAMLKKEHGPDAIQPFFSKLREVFGENLVVREAPQAKPMTDKEAEAFQEQPMPFGQHRGKPIAEVVLSYLDWLVEQPDDFKEKLNRYLLSEMVKRERESMDEE